MNIVDRVTSIEQRIATIQSIGDFERIRNLVGKTAPVSRVTLDSIINESSQRWNVEPNLVKAIVENESGFNVRATSQAGAQGLMQLMPETAAALGVTDSYNPEQNIAGGTRYLRSLLNRFNGDIRLAIAAYNAGPNAVIRYGNVPPYPETKNYVANVLASYHRYQASRA